MLKQKYSSAMAQMNFKSRLWIFFLVLSALTNVMLAWKIVSIDTRERIVIHPITMMQDYVIDGDDVDPNYIGKLSEEFLRARFLYTPKTVTTQFGNLVKNFHPAIYGEKKAELSTEASRIIRNDETSVFFPMSIHVKQKTAYVEAEITGYIGKKQVNNEVRTFQVDFKDSGERLWIADWKEVSPVMGGKQYHQVAEKPDENAAAGDLN